MESTNNKNGGVTSPTSPFPVIARTLHNAVILLLFLVNRSSKELAFYGSIATSFITIGKCANYTCLSHLAISYMYLQHSGFFELIAVFLCNPVETINKIN